MYGHFVQFTFPKIGQAVVAVVLYLNFLRLPFVAYFADGAPLLYLGLPLVLLGLVSWIGRDPLGPGMIFNAHLMGFYLAGDLLGLLMRLAGGRGYAVWQAVWMGGLQAWMATAAMMEWGGGRASRASGCWSMWRRTPPLPPRRCALWAARTGCTPRAAAFLPASCCPAGRTGSIPSCWTMSPGN